MLSALLFPHSLLLLPDTLSCSPPPHLCFSAKGFLRLVVLLCQTRDIREAPRDFHSISQKQPSIGDSWEQVYKHPSSVMPRMRSLHCAARQAMYALCWFLSFRTGRGLYWPTGIGGLITRFLSAFLSLSHFLTPVLLFPVLPK